MKTLNTSQFQISKSIMLLGYRGAGKTTLAKHLGKKLGIPIESTDHWIETKHSCTIPKLIAEQGWKKFRTEEEKAVQTILKKEPLILDGGGGIIENLKLMDALVAKLILVYIEVPFKTILKRLEKDPRPKLTSLETLEAETRLKLAERTPLYEKYAHFTLTTHPNPIHMVETLIHRLIEQKLIEKI